MPPRMKRITEEEAMAQVKADMDKMRVQQPAAQSPPSGTPAAPSSVASLPKPPEKQRILPINFNRIEFGYAQYFAKLTKDQTLEHVVDPTFWSHIAETYKADPSNGRKGLRRGDMIRLWKPSTGLRGWATIMEVAHGHILIDIDSSNEPPEVAIPDNSPLEVFWRERRDGDGTWDVVRKSDVVQSPLASGFQIKASAARWIIQHIATMAA